MQKAHDEYQKYLKQVKERKKKGEDAHKDASSLHSTSGRKKTKSDSNHTATQPPLPPSTGTTAQTASAYPTAGYSQGYTGAYAQGQYPAGYNYGQYPQPPQPQGTDATYQNNYQNWNAYQQSSYYNNQTGWGGYYPNY